MPVTRSRRLPTKGAPKGKIVSENATTVDGLSSATGTQITVSEGHPFRRSGKLGREDLGGEFYTSKSYCESEPTRISGVSRRPGSTSRFFSCPVYPVNNATLISGSGQNFPYPPASTSTDAELRAAGATAISRCAPGNSPANVLTFLGELYKDGLPSLVGSQLWHSRASRYDPRKDIKSSGGEYLNAQFGWAPLVRDISSFANAVIHADRVLAQYERDAGRVVRRRYRFPSEVTRTESRLNGGTLRAFPTNSDLSAVTPGITRVRETTRTRWFSGAFTYHLPTDYDSRRQMARRAARAKYLLGANMSPEVLWEVMPWSWAADWFSNTGDVIKNLSRFASQGLIMRYGYMMETTIVRDTYTCDPVSSGNSYSLIANGHHIAPLVLVTETKVRKRANPYGFGVSWEGLSAFQLSILAALGVTRGR